MSKLTVKACIHTINPFGFNQNEGTTSCMGYGPF